MQKSTINILTNQMFAEKEPQVKALTKSWWNSLCLCPCLCLCCWRLFSKTLTSNSTVTAYSFMFKKNWQSKYSVACIGFVTDTVQCFRSLRKATHSLCLGWTASWNCPLHSPLLEQLPPEIAQARSLGAFTLRVFYCQAGNRFLSLLSFSFHCATP